MPWSTKLVTNFLYECLGVACVYRHGLQNPFYFFSSNLQCNMWSTAQGMSWTLYIEKRLFTDQSISSIWGMLLIAQPGTSQEGTLQKQYPEGNTEHLNALIHIDTLILKYWQAEETLNQSCKETPDWKRPLDKCITLHINYILTTQGWISMKRRHCNSLRGKISS